MINFEYIDNIKDDKDLESASKEESLEEETQQEESVEAASVEKTPVEDAPADESAEAALAEKTPVEDAPVEESAEVTPVEEASVEDAPVEESSEASPVNESSKEDLSKNKNKDSFKKDVDFIFTNIIGKKIGMTQLFSEEGNVFPATIIEAGPCSVIQIKNFDTDGYKSVQIGYDDILNKNKSNKATLGHFNKSKSTPKRVLKEFRVLNDQELPKLGDIVDVNQFNPGEYVTVTGYSIGKGFAGHMKRHGFGGGRASHGKNSVMRKSGSVGAGTSPGRIFPGMKMAGRMGNDKVSVKNLQILDIDYSSNLIFVKGSIPGSKNNYIYLKKN